MKLFLVGGFLGSGKTTAIGQAARYLFKIKKKVGVITNDQGKHQVDTQYIRSQNVPVEEVSDGCFCCNFQELEKSIKFLKDTVQPDIIFAESVGSCTDLIATVINPFLDFYENQFEIVFSVFADVRLLLNYLQQNDEIFLENVNYIYGNQLEEADIIIVNKIDLLNDEQLKLVKQLIESEYDDKIILYQNSLDNESIQNWVTTICDNYQKSSLRQSLQLDYNIYGAGEAELGWLNEEIGIVTKDTNAVAIGFILINKIHNKIIQQGYPIGHLKFLMNDGQQQKKISFTTIPEYNSPHVQNDFKTDRIVILINARVQVQAILVKKIISDSILELEALTGCKVVESKIEVFQPGYPKPTYRMQNF